jgi:hypothetical protein
MPLEHDFDQVSECPYCGVVNDGIANMTGDEMPEDGDPTICMSCGIIGVVSSTSPTGLRRPTKAERSMFLRDPLIKKALWAWHVVDELRRADQRRSPT